MMKVHVIQSPISDITKVYIMDTELDRRITYNLDKDSNVIGTFLPLESTGKELHPFITVRNEFFNKFVLGILEYASEHKIELETETAKSAKIESMSVHLDDARKHLNDCLEFILKK